jgi:hypothetical protein
MEIVSFGRDGKCAYGRGKLTAAKSSSTYFRALNRGSSRTKGKKQPKHAKYHSLRAGSILWAARQSEQPGPLPKGLVKEQDAIDNKKVFKQATTISVSVGQMV